MQRVTMEQDELAAFAIVQCDSDLAFMLDADDLPILGDYRWWIFNSRGCLYAARNQWFPELKRGKVILLHREIMEAPQGVTVDHIDGNGLNNRRGNLRLCSFKDNQRNYHNKRRSKTGYRGVYATDSGKYQVLITISRKQRHYGTFTDPVEAAKRRDAIVREAFGEYATLNFPYGEM